ncbi:hypothetical protein FVEN_g13201 [Fusarium venenatum]|nr:hypothetical protein FVEN_g13201 [Fusarium venenatum]
MCSLTVSLSSSKFEPSANGFLFPDDIADAQGSVVAVGKSLEKVSV